MPTEWMKVSDYTDRGRSSCIWLRIKTACLLILRKQWSSYLERNSQLSVAERPPEIDDCAWCCMDAENNHSCDPCRAFHEICFVPPWLNVDSVIHKISVFSLSCRISYFLITTNYCTSVVTTMCFTGRVAKRATISFQKWKRKETVLTELADNRGAGAVRDHMFCMDRHPTNGQGVALSRPVKFVVCD